MQIRTLCKTHKSVTLSAVIKLVQLHMLFRTRLQILTHRLRFNKLIWLNKQIGLEPIHTLMISNKMTRQINPMNYHKKKKIRRKQRFQAPSGTLSTTRIVTQTKDPLFMMIKKCRNPPRSKKGARPEGHHKVE